MVMKAVSAASILEATSYRFWTRLASPFWRDPRQMPCGVVGFYEG